MCAYRKTIKVKEIALDSLILAVFLFTLFCVSKTSIAAETKDLIEAAKKEREVVFYASMNIAEANEMIAKFEEKYPFLKVKLTRAGSEKILTKVLTEAMTKKDFADVIQTPGFSMHTFKTKGILGRYVSSEDVHYPSDFKEKGYWTTVYMNPYVLAYNTRMVSQEKLPKTYVDLLHPVWRGKIMMEGTKLDWFAGMLQIMGKEKGLMYMRDLSKQNVMLRVGHSLLAQLVAAGEGIFDINIPNYSVERLKSAGAPIDWTALGPVPTTTTGIGITSQPPHPNAAKLFVDFVLSKEGQKLVRSLDKLVARSDFVKEQAAETKGIRMVPVNPALAQNLDEYSKEMRDIFSK